MEDMVYVTEDVYMKLLDADRFLDALIATGVDNWDGYKHAHEILAEWDGEDE